MPGYQQSPKNLHELVGVVPAAGTASRLGRLPCSKELLPIGLHKNLAGKKMGSKVVGGWLLERMKIAKISRAFLILRRGKWDIPAYFGNGKNLGIHLAYLLMDLPYGVPYTLDQAYPFVKDSMVVFGFPDIYFEPLDAFKQLLTRKAESGSDIVLGIFPADQPHKADMVEINKEGCIQRIDIKPTSTHLRYTWIIAVWTPTFTKFMHDFVADHKSRHVSARMLPSERNDRELYVGDVINAAIQKGIQLESVLFPKGRYLDIGTPEDLKKAFTMDST